MDYTMPETIAYRLSKMRPWTFVETTRRDNIPQHECMFCAWRKYINEPNMYRAHDPACLWVAAARYADELDNAPVASQEPAGSPIESRVNELLGETDFSHLHSLEMRLEREREFLTHAKTPSETRARQAWISQIEKEIQCEREHLGLNSRPDLTDDELLAELMK